MTELTIADTSIRRDIAGRYCLNDLHRAAGSESKHQPAFFLRRKETADLLNEWLSSADSQSLEPVIQVLGKGKEQGTYVVKELVYAYAMWISPAFSLRVIRAFDALVMGDVEKAQRIAGSTMPTSVSHRADHVVSATRCFNGLMRAAASLRLGQGRAALAANQAAIRYTGVDILNELGVEPEELPDDLRRPAADDTLPLIKAWLESSTAADVTSEEIVAGVFGIAPGDPDYRGAVVRAGIAMSRLGWKRRERRGDYHRRYVYQRPAQ